jgi:hypothetical protein
LENRQNMNTWPHSNEVVVLTTVLVFLAGLGVGTFPSFWFRKRFRFMDHSIEIRNNIFGWETIVVDNQVLVSKFTFWLGTHQFMIGQDKAEVTVRPRWLVLGVRIRFLVNDQVFYED